jgi:hypothetical protein
LNRSISSGFYAAFVAITVAGPRRICTGLPLSLRVEGHYNESETLSRFFYELVHRAPHPNAAKIYINWLLSREGQTLWSQLSGYASRRLDVPKDHVNPMTLPKDGIEYQPNYKEEYVRLREEILTFLKEIIQK